MTWFVFALLSAISYSGMDIFNKLGLKKVEPIVVAWVSMTIAFPFALVSAYIEGIPTTIPDEYWMPFGISLISNLFAVFLGPRILKVADLSVVAPLTATGPLFTAALAPFILGETLNLPSIVGIILIVVGTYVLALSKEAKGVLGPFKHLWSHPGVKMLAVLLVCSTINSLVDPIGVRATTGSFFIGTKFAIICLVLTPFAFRKSVARFKSDRKYLTFALLAGVASTISALCHGWALIDGLAAPVIATKRTSAVFTVLLAWVLLGEKGARNRIIGSVIIVAGIYCLMLT